MARYVVCKIEDFPASGRMLVEVNRRPVVIFRLGQEWFGLLNTCPHQGGSLFNGYQAGLAESDRPADYRYSRQGEIIRCPWHGWEFDIRTGRSRCRPDAVKVAQFALAVAGGREIESLDDVKGVETFDVKPEGEYLLLSL
ncbi:MAG TPA: Rieske (2Fe-2S) protein [Kaistia sp.]|nr:Rieske (2Fe-2S) protein [Kaistia sp.]